MIELGPNRYGKAAVRVVRVHRDREPHRVDDVTVAIALEGDFEAAHTAGDNANVIATDTMKNTAYAFALDRLDGSIEAYARALAEHFTEAPQVSAATVSVEASRWRAIGVSVDSFVRDGAFVRTASIRADATGRTVEAGVDGLTVMKTTRSGFSGFPRDRFTTLPETDDRLLATKVTATWRYVAAKGADGVDYDALFEAVLATLLDVFAEHESPSVQASIWVLGRAVLERHPEVDEIRFRLPNLHHWLADLEPFGLPNPKAVYVATTEPHGLIEATVRRS